MTKLRVWSTVGDAYRFVFGDATRLVRLTWFWWVATLWVGLAASTAARRAGLIEHRYQGWLIEYLVLAPIFSAFSVSWHRNVLIGKDPPWTSIHLGAREGRYTLFLFVILALTVAPYAPLRTGDVDLGAMEFVADALLIVCSVIIVRFSLCLPAIATERRLRLADSWRLTRGNTLRLIGGGGLIWGPISFLTGFFGALTAGLSGLVAMTGTFLEVALSVCFLSLAYRQLTSEPAADGAGDVSSIANPI